MRISIHAATNRLSIVVLLLKKCVVVLLLKRCIVVLLLKRYIAKTCVRVMYLNKKVIAPVIVVTVVMMKFNSILYSNVKNQNICTITSNHTNHTNKQIIDSPITSKRHL